MTSSGTTAVRSNPFLLAFPSAYGWGVFYPIKTIQMFKNATLYYFIEHAMPTLDTALTGHEFTPCGASQEKSTGWVPPRNEPNGALIELIGGQRILKFMAETKTVPASVVKRKVAEQLATIEAQTGRKPGKKETREIAEDARQALLPMAFTKLSATLVWIDPVAGTVLIDSTSRARVDDVATLLVQTFDGLVLTHIQTVTSPAAAMANWLLTKEAPQNFTVDRECELKACDESRAVVKYNRHNLDTDEVQNHIYLGKVPTKLALTWNDRVSFVLTDYLQIKKIAFLESVFEGAADRQEADAFDADVAIATGELRKLIPDLLDALGGVPDDLFAEGV